MIFPICFGRNIRTMSTFVSRINRITGKMEWDFRDDEYDFKQEIARSSYADMLHDTERNRLYYEGLKVAIELKRKAGQAVHVLDIGTGTGLLSMMAARLGADTVHACEAFTPMAECAKKIIAENGFTDKITVIPKRSTELKIGPDMPCRANILVTEVFDTELIGEGAISTFTHAHNELLEEGCIVVPSRGTVFIQLVSSELVRRWNQITDFSGPLDLRTPPGILRCGGAPSLHDLQLDQLPEDKFTKLSEPFKVFSFDFTGQSPLLADRTTKSSVEMIVSGSVDAVFMWWDLEMDPEGEITLSCAPHWAHPTPHNMQWRDHWMQAIYYPYSQLTVEKGETINVISKHDEYSLWFDVAKGHLQGGCLDDRPICTCGAHIAYSRSRMGMLSDPARRDTYTRILKQHIKAGESTVLCISDGSLLPLMAARLGAKHVYVIESNFLCTRVMGEFVTVNGLKDRVTILDRSVQDIQAADIPDKIDIVVGEPVFQTAVLPWDAISFWYIAQALGSCLSPGLVCLPRTLTVYALPVEYEHLWKIRANVGVSEGFDISQFDKLIQSNSESVDEVVEPQPLWEYPCRASGPVMPVLTVDGTQPLDSMPLLENVVQLHVDSNQPCNGIALWAEFNFGDDHVISTGPTQPIKIGCKVIWDYYSKQGVHLFYNNTKSSGQLLTNSAIEATVKFDPAHGELCFKFTPHWSNS
ncbi:protein arginine N-methyltransferase 7-like isoform X1 [Dreissena polymorpha]|uniref:protein arginine N-methyltransferase 7-like isoform X1 n=1 Tax=Dreissena polymorpha TaxID=45954 RepID=UPI002264E5D2|nr:protein arginine N-methyltransferase 7-like isoform X1 [Dreissena polymorpha]